MHILVTNILLLNLSVLANIGYQNVFTPRWLRKCSICRAQVFSLPAASKTVRSPHPPYVFLRVGEVVMEMKGHMVGVVVSWDPEMRAPPEWAGRLYASSEVGSQHSCTFKNKSSAAPSASESQSLRPCVRAGHHRREHASLQGAVQRARTLLGDRRILASDAAEAHHRNKGMYPRSDVESHTLDTPGTHCRMILAGHSDAGALLHALQRGALRHAALAQKALPR